MSVEIKKKRKGRLTFAIAVLLAASAGVAGGYGFKNVANHHQISDYVRTHSVRKLQIGAGGAGRFPEFANWLNTDIEPAKGKRIWTQPSLFHFRIALSPSYSPSS